MVHVSAPVGDVKSEVFQVWFVLMKVWHIVGAIHLPEAWPQHQRGAILSSDGMKH